MAIGTDKGVVGVVIGEVGVANGEVGVASGEVGVASGEVGVASGEVGVASGVVGVASGEVGVASGVVGVAVGVVGVAVGVVGVAAGVAGVVDAPKGWPPLSEPPQPASGSKAIISESIFLFIAELQSGKVAPRFPDRLAREKESRQATDAPFQLQSNGGDGSTLVRRRQAGGQTK